MSLYDLISTSSCAACTTTTTGDGTVIDNDTLSTTIVSSASYLSTSCPHNHIVMERANNYIESMSIVELDEFEKALDEKLSLYIEEPDKQENTEEHQKVYVKENKGQ